VALEWACIWQGKRL